MVNTATFFRVGFTMIRPFIGQRTADRFMPLGTDWHDKVRQRDPKTFFF